MSINVFIIELLFGFLSSLGFGLITNIPRRILLAAGFTGAMSWGAYYIFSLFTAYQVVWPNLLATTIIGFLGNYFAHRLKTPATMIYIPSLVSLVPGGLAAVGLQNFTTGHSAQASEQLLVVLLTAVALAAGFIVGETLFKMALSVVHKLPYSFHHK